jgi:hypothetical protein
MQNLDNNMWRHECIMMEYDMFKELIDKLTDGLKSVEYEFEAYIEDSEKSDIEGRREERNICDILSAHFGVNVTSWHSDTNDENPCVWIVYNEGLKTGQLSNAEMQQMMDENSVVKGVIEIELAEVIDNDFESFLDVISEKLTGSTLLMGTDYSIVGRNGNAILLAVTGDASMILEDE